ncbi:T9SS type A sorting domain-containing protein [Hymenobacter psychrotolerans]|uniref:Por secretion system C-terminal sorting domain-containing protein n=1 Tax=Hymenobacter psychrotolerans DSM 18569 TaxID=1121959 RepID=A0A1M7DXP6_9BACT|nr:T9SS type A sorting domain-containing protein [Hymenobacter psychrotolerans]SHL84118.1 Por secretion system C-terminal sorting domain-containing protein [Hymenobacter psychrotolerans DSM 18569]
MKTTNGGTSWVTQGTAFSSTDSYPNLIHFFNANDGVAQGDPLTDGGPFEVYTTSDGGTTWTPATTPATLSGEYGAEAQPAVSGNTIWFGTLEGRIFRSSDKGLTWSVSNAALPDGVFALAFRDAQNGLANSFNLDSGAKVLKRTTDGGATWTTVSYTGLFPGFGLDNVPGTQQYIATGLDVAGTGNSTGSSYSRDNGQTWVTLETAISHTRVDAVSPTAIWSGAIDDNTFGGLGMNRLTTTTLGSRAASPEQLGFSVYPNPSTDGRFVVGSKVARTGVELRVSDALGREVTRRAWQGSTATPFTLDLSQYKAGVYTLEIRSEAGTSHQKLVVR